MSEEPRPEPVASDALQFDQVEYAGGPPAAACAFCQQPIQGSYYEVNGAVVCSGCREVLAQSLAGGSRSGRVLKAFFFGTAAAVAGAVVYGAVLLASKIDFALLTILIGWMVGKAVRNGSEGRGGWFYQAMAVFLTYNAIVLTHLTFAIVMHHKERDGRRQPGAEQKQGEAAPKPAPGEAPKADEQVRLSLAETLVALAMFVGVVYAAPFMGGAQNIIGLIIIAVGLYEAWILNRRVPIVIEGPYQLGARPPEAADATPGS